LWGGARGHFGGAASGGTRVVGGKGPKCEPYTGMHCWESVTGGGGEDEAGAGAEKETRLPPLKKTSKKYTLMKENKEKIPKRVGQEVGGAGVGSPQKTANPKS